MSSDRDVLKEKLSVLAKGIPLDPLPPAPVIDPSVPHAPRRTMNLSAEDQQLAVKNALRYFPSSTHGLLAPEFATELRDLGHIYMHRFRPTAFAMRSYDQALYPARTVVGRCLLHQLFNNLDPRVAQFPHELITYGTNGQVLSNWAQFWIMCAYLCEMNDSQTLSMTSGHPAGLFPSHKLAPRMIMSNGMVVGNHSGKDEFERLRALSTTMYGQMTAGSLCYIGPQGIVHGTMLTVLNAGRLYLGTGADMSGHTFISSGLGGMSGAQGKAGKIAGAVAVIAEVNRAALDKRLEQGWIDEVHEDVPSVIKAISQYKAEKRAVAIAYSGNVVDLLEGLASHAESTGELLGEILSDQTSCHAIESCGYTPCGLTYEEASAMASRDNEAFIGLVRGSLRRHAEAIGRLCAQGARFFDYGNAFLLEASRSGADVLAPGSPTDGSAPRVFKYPSYVQHIMGEIFSLGFGPFRWFCASTDPGDLRRTDEIATRVVAELRDAAPEETRLQYEDNLRWIKGAEGYGLVVGSQGRILYSDAAGRTMIALAFNKAVRDGEIGPVVLSRDHHDVSGTDSPYRETSSVADGSSPTADMAVNNHTGLAARGVSWVALHNGGGVGWGEVVNGGFGLVLDGSEDLDSRIPAIFAWDVGNGVARRAWAGSKNARWNAKRMNEDKGSGVEVTVASEVDDGVVRAAVEAATAAAKK